MILPKRFSRSFLVSICLCAHPCFASSAPPESDEEGLYVYVQSLGASKSVGDGIVNFSTPMPDYQQVELSNGTQTPYDSAKAYFSGQASPFPYVESYAYAIDSPGFDATGLGVEATAHFDLTYWVNVPGPAGEIVTVDVIVNQGVSIATSHSITNPSSVSAVGYPGVEITADSPDETQIGITELGRSETTFRQLSDTWFAVQMYTSAGAVAQDGSASSMVWTDPQFLIDPSTPDAGLYSIVPGDGFGNAPASAVPEPPTWAMMLMGFALLGFASWRASRGSTIAA